jgi:KDO2-lipid IV(A) lauroyltransferase
MYHVVYGILYLISLLPLRILYVLSDAVYGVLYYITGYRRKVVMHNLQIAFPGMPEAERKKIAKKYYHNLADSFVETIKMISVNEKFILKRFTGNWEVINDVYKTGRNCNLLLGHTFNWEWGNESVGLNLLYDVLVVYMPVSSKIFDRLFLKLRSRNKTIMLSAFNMRKDLLPYRNKQYLLGLAADQNPGNPGTSYWLNFFGRPTPFVTGPEKSSRSRNAAAAFCYIEKIKRGYYNMVITMGEDQPKLLQEGELTVKYVRFLENVIRKQPDMWLWSHKRWKHSWKDEYAKLWVDEKEARP